MGESNDFAMGYAMGQDSNGGSSSNNGGGMFGGDGWLGLILFAMIFGNGGWGGGFGGGGGGALTRAELYDGFATQNIDSAVRGVQQGICDSTYALNTSIASGFHGVDRGLCDLSHQISDCCCATREAISGVNFNLSKGLCDLGNVINMQTRDIVENQNANYRSLMDFMVQEKMASKDARIAELTEQLGRSQQNGVIGARIDAAVAELLRRTGNDCPTAAYLVQPPTPVNFPTNGCGTVQLNGFNGGGCGCGCGC